MDAPLNAVVGPKQLRSYRQVFHLLWRLKRGDFVLSSCWRQHMSAAKARLPQRLPKLAKHLHEANLVRNNLRGGGEIDCMRASFYDLRRERERELKVSKRKIVNYSLLNLTVCFYSRFWSGAKQHVAFGAKPLQLHGK